MTTVAAQKQMLETARAKNAEIDKMFQYLVETGLTREDLQRNIERRPALWSRFAGWLDKLPSAKEQQT